MHAKVARIGFPNYSNWTTNLWKKTELIRISTLLSIFGVFLLDYTSLFENGLMRKAAKSNLAKAIKQNISPSKPTFYQLNHILDGGALLHKVRWLPNSTYQCIINQYLNYVKAKL